MIAGLGLLLAGMLNAKQPHIQNQNSNSDEFLVVKVIDGDTVEVNISGKVQKVRLLGIDTPELHDPRKPVQCFGREAYEKSQELLGGQKVRLESDLSQGDLDKYGRLLRYVFLPDGQMVNFMLVEGGFAHEYTYQSNPHKYQANFRHAQEQAKDAGKGFWSQQTCQGNTKLPA